MYRPGAIRRLGFDSNHPAAYISLARALGRTKKCSPTSARLNFTKLLVEVPVRGIFRFWMRDPEGCCDRRFSVLYYCDGCKEENPVRAAFRNSTGKATFDNIFQSVYLSMVTITTTGYGDITPLRPVSVHGRNGCGNCAGGTCRRCLHQRNQDSRVGRGTIPENF